MKFALKNKTAKLIKDSAGNFYIWTNENILREETLN